MSIILKLKPHDDKKQMDWTDHKILMLFLQNEFHKWILIETFEYQVVQTYPG